ncbi:MAG: hypothetical protein US89_C0023G0001 [Candidatus Peregrinibacteria bacterium GW2011_GWF2_38_29]|nr:MAG: hypothetical protein US89_C0023G0001 [Candidatus Peregrinibacteria bacterium GW2011_GWF2_38_29]HBB03114.1 hypothetical protein [Candidatus Peregrinibacteria bacterium]
MQLNTYSFPEIFKTWSTIVGYDIERKKDQKREELPTDEQARITDVIGEIESPELALINELQRYIELDVARVFLAELVSRKDVYDNEGQEDKTPYALKEMQDPLEREIAISNISTIGMTYGCTEGCPWCFWDAPIVKQESMPRIPLVQKKNLAREMYGIWVKNYGKEVAKAKMQSSRWHKNTDPLNDPDLYEFLLYCEEISGGSPFLYTVLPEAGEEMLIKLAEAECKRIILNSLKNVKFRFQAFTAICKKIGCETLQEVYDKMKEGVRNKESMYGLTWIQLQNLIDNIDELNWCLQERGLKSIFYYHEHQEEVSEVERELAKIEEEIRGIPSPDIRISVNDKNKDRVEKLKKRKGLKLSTERVDKKTAVLQGVSFYRSGAEEGHTIEGSYTGLDVGPFGLTNVVEGCMSKSFPQSRIMVPFKGLIRDNQLACPGQNLGDILQHVIVIKDLETLHRFKGVFIFDGDRRLRKIKFDLKNYTVISDEVVGENIKSDKELKEIRKKHRD